MDVVSKPVSKVRVFKMAPQGFASSGCGMPILGLSPVPVIHQVLITLQCKPGCFRTGAHIDLCESCSIYQCRFLPEGSFSEATA